jgi:hypothetical protein
MKRVTIILLVAFITASCSSLIKYKPAKDEFKNVEFEKKVKIVEAPSEVNKALLPNLVEDQTDMNKPQTSHASGDDKVENKSSKKDKKSKLIKSTKSSGSRELKKKILSQVIQVPGEEAAFRQPDLEDREGFANKRRPLVDPFRVGEIIEHKVAYLGATAGTLKFLIKPFAVVNGKKSFNFIIDLKSTAFFSKVYAVDDVVQTFVDYEELVPHVFKLNIRDSGQVKEAQSYFDNINLKADYWEHRYTEKNGHEEKKLTWSILPYSQNPFSAVFYMRVFKWTIGKEYSFRVADDEKNVIFRGRALEKTTLNTEAGKFNAIKIKAEVYSRGNLAKATDFYMWISDDDRKFILRIEVKLPIGSLTSEVVEIVKGKN